MAIYDIGSRRRYKAKLYINGEFVNVKPYIGQLVQIITGEQGFIVTKEEESFQYATSNNEIFMPNSVEEMVIASASEGENNEVIRSFGFVRVMPYIDLITGSNIPDNVLVDNYGRYLVDNYDKYLVP